MPQTPRNTTSASSAPIRTTGEPPEPAFSKPAGADKTKDVKVTVNGAVTLPSEASYALEPGAVLSLSPADAEFLVSSGRAVYDEPEGDVTVKES